MFDTIKEIMKLMNETSIITEECMKAVIFTREYRITYIDYENKSRCTDILRLTRKEKRELINALNDPKSHKAIFHRLNISDNFRSVEFFKDGAIAIV